MTTRRVVVTGARRAAVLMLMLTTLGAGAAMAGARVSLGRAPTCQPIPRAVPEIDPGSALGALTLLTGGLMVVTDRRRKAH